MDKHKKEGDNRNTVTSIGNSWVVCRSKSHPGYNYYFNTFTGETLWNLSDPEVEKAKTKTKLLESQPGNNLEHFPEPKDNPPPSTMDFTKKTSTHSRIYNKQIINNKFPRQQYTIQSLPNTGACYNPLNPMNVMPLRAPPTFDSIVWDVPPVPLVPLVSQVQASLFNQTQQSLALALNQMQSNILAQTIPLSHCNGPTQPVRHIGKPKPKYWKGKYGYRQGHNGNSIDLREKLSTRKRPIYNNSRFDNDVEETTSSLDGEEDSDQNMHERCMENYQEKSSKIDMTPLRDLATSNVNPDCWFIVADTNVILRNFNYLNNLTDSDEACHLMVPKHVMSELRSLARDTHNVNVHARRITRFLSQQIDDGFAYIADETSDGAVDENSILDTCLKLTQQNYHVVLISDNKKLLEFNNTTLIPIFTIEDLKQMLKRGSTKQAVRTKCVPERLIKITVQNPNHDNTTSSQESTVVSEHSVNENITKEEEQISSIPQIREINIEYNTPATTRLALVETGVQTDFTTQESNYEDNLDSTHNNTDNTFAASANNPLENVDDSTHINAAPGKTKIKLKRSIPIQKSLDNEPIPVKKKYKWRSKRDTTVAQANEPSTSYFVPHDDDKIKQQPNDVSVISAADVNAETLFGEQSIDFSCSSPRNEDHVESHGSSIILQPNINSQIVIEDTSTTGVISNTESNVDSEISYNQVETKTRFRTENVKNAFLKNVMFEISDKGMEEYLTMRRDEWVSRFVQIMEEVLSQVLQKDPPFESREFPPPWTLHEATQCVIKKFSNCYYVVDAANKLSIVLFRLSDRRGKITMTMKPSEYMEMYSYGVYLVEALQNENINCEDLQTAAESLKTILIDIQNPNMDCAHNDTFSEVLQEPPVDVIQTTSIEGDTDFSSSLQNESSKKQINTPEKSQSSSKYNLRSSKEKSDQGPKVPQENMNKSSFFSCLELQTNNSSCDSKIRRNSHEISETINECTAGHVDDQKKDSVATEPKIIRQFSKCSKFEELLKKRKEPSEFDYEGGENDDFTEDNEYYGYEEKETIEPQNTYNNCGANNSTEIVNTDANNNKKIKCFIGTLLKHVGEAFLQTKLFCEKSCNALKDPHQLSSVKMDIGIKAVKAHTHIVRLCQSLDSILRRDTNDPENDISVLLKRADVNINLDQNLQAEYRHIVTTCKDQANILLTTIKMIISAANC